MSLESKSPQNQSLETKTANAVTERDKPARPARILFQLSGSIACFKACAVLSSLVQKGYDIEVVASPSALEFVGAATLEGLTGKKTHTGVFARGEYMNHIRLMRWADVVVLCPASANKINQLSLGLGDDLIATLFLAHDFLKPYIIAPAMNEKMYTHPATVAALERLTSFGVDVLTTAPGALACGEVGLGRLLEPSAIVERITQAADTQLAKPQLDPIAKQGTAHSNTLAAKLAAAANVASQQRALQSRPRVLVTAGGTREAIDGVRALTNLSTGKTGATIAEVFAARGADVTYLAASDAPSLTTTHEANSHSGALTRTIRFVSYRDLQSLLKTELETHDYDAVIHAAAVSDYQVAAIRKNGVTIDDGSAKRDGHKIDSGDTLSIELTKTEKIVDQIKSWSRNSSVKLIAFKLTHSANEHEARAAVAKLARHSKADGVVHNDVAEWKHTHPFHVYSIQIPTHETSQTLDHKVDVFNAHELAHSLFETVISTSSEGVAL